MDDSTTGCEQVVLDDGTALVIRPIRPGDKAMLSEGFVRLSAESRRRRFLAPKNALTERELRYFTECDGVNHYAIGALSTGGPGRGPEGVGVARFVRAEDDPAVAELAIVVADAWQRRGIGTRLLKHIVRAAAERGIEEIRATSLSDNHQLRALLARVSPSLAISRPQGGVVEFRLPVTALAEPETPDVFAQFLRLIALGTVIVPLRLGRISIRGMQALIDRDRRETRGEKP